MSGMVTSREAQAAQAALREKRLVALASVGAAIGLTSLKLSVGLFTGSLGILAEAAHSGLDLVAALLTFFAVRYADRPADASHPYGHEKAENLSAFLEACLLLITAGWIIFEALRRLILHEGQVDNIGWAFLVMAVSIAVDFTRSRALLRTARRLGSQALEADALHFSTDIWSSSVVIAGLFIVFLAQQLHLPDWLKQADALAALGVTGIVIWVSLRLARDTIDALLDRAPEVVLERLQTAVAGVEDVVEVRRTRVRRAGNKMFADVVVEAPRTLSFEQTHDLSERIEGVATAAIHESFPQSGTDVVVHVEPMRAPGETVKDRIHYLAELHGVHAHDIRLRDVGGRLEADFDVEVRPEMNLREAHETATRLEEDILQSDRRVSRVTTHLEAPAEQIEPRDEVTNEHTAMVRRMLAIADRIAGKGSAHDARLYQPCAPQSGAAANGATDQAGELDLVLHLTFDPDAPISQVHIWAEEIERALRLEYPQLASVVIHTEPIGE